MIGVFIFLLFLALITVIWGKTAAPNFLYALGKLVIWLVVIGLVAVAPTVMLPIMLLYGLFLVFQYAYRKGKANKPIASQKQLTNGLQISKNYVQTALGTSDNAPPQRCMPRARATTVMPNPPPNPIYTATYFPHAGGGPPIYWILEEVTGEQVTLSPEEYNRDWLPWLDAPAAKPQVQRPSPVQRVRP